MTGRLLMNSAPQWTGADEHISYEVRQVSDESVFVWFRYVGIPVYDKDHKPYKIMGKTLDITGEKKKNQELLEQKAERDSLTDLYNKAKMRKLVEKHIRQADDTEGALSSLILMTLKRSMTLADIYTVMKY